MKIGIEVNGVLRNTLKKIQEVYEKWDIDNPLLLEEDSKKNKIISDVTTLELKNHLPFQTEEEIFNFLYDEYTMEIFGHAGSMEYSSMNDLNELYLELRDEHEIWILSDEITKSKPATLFFLSKFGCLVENYKFYSKITLSSMWDTIDCLVTDNPELLNNHPKNKTLIKYKSTYNSHITTQHEVEYLKDIKQKILQLC